MQDWCLRTYPKPPQRKAVRTSICFDGDESLMTTLTIEALAVMLLPGQPIAGLDLGTKTIGLAMSDLGRRFATPRPVLRREKFSIDAEVLLGFAAKEKVTAFVIGLPMN